MSSLALDLTGDRATFDGLDAGAQAGMVWIFAHRFHAEFNVARLLAPFLLAAPDYEMQLLLATQVADEHRHLQAENARRRRAEWGKILAREDARELPAEKTEARFGAFPDGARGRRSNTSIGVEHGAQVGDASPAGATRQSGVSAGKRSRRAAAPA